MRLIKASSLQNSQDSWLKTHKPLPWGRRSSKQEKNLLWCSCLQVTEETLETQLPRVTAQIGVGFSVKQLPPPKSPMVPSVILYLTSGRNLNKTHWITKLDLNRIFLLVVVLISLLLTSLSPKEKPWNSYYLGEYLSRHNLMDSKRTPLGIFLYPARPTAIVQPTSREHLTKPSPSDIGDVEAMTPSPHAMAISTHSGSSALSSLPTTPSIHYNLKVGVRETFPQGFTSTIIYASAVSLSCPWEVGGKM